MSSFLLRCAYSMLVVAMAGCGLVIDTDPPDPKNRVDGGGGSMDAGTTRDSGMRGDSGVRGDGGRTADAWVPPDDVGVEPSDGGRRIVDATLVRDAACLCPADFRCTSAGLCVECLTEADCDSGQYCHQGSCVECVETSDCPDPVSTRWSPCDYQDACDIEAVQTRTTLEYMCVGGVCMDNVITETEPCQRDTAGDSCDDGIACNGADLCERGTCTHEGSPCPMGAVCFEGTGGYDCALAPSCGIDDCADFCTRVYCAAGTECGCDPSTGACGCIPLATP